MYSYMYDNNLYYTVAFCMVASVTHNTGPVDTIFGPRFRALWGQQGPKLLYIVYFSALVANLNVAKHNACCPVATIQNSTVSANPRNMCHNTSNMSIAYNLLTGHMMYKYSMPIFNVL
jgi:hypothetical protein